MIEPLPVPVVIICKDRIRYLDLELKSITATCPSALQVWVSNDGTRNDRMIRYLTTQDPVPLDDDWQFPQHNQEWNRLIGPLPNVDPVRGIGGKVNVIMHGVSAGTKNLGLAVKYVFEHTRAPYVIKMEDDLVFTAGWYSTLIRATAESGCDLVSGFRYFYGKLDTRSINADVEEVYGGYTGATLFIASRKYYRDCPYVFNNDIATIWDNDDFWIDECRKHNMKLGVLKRSVCQHIGFRTESKQTGFLRHGRLKKVDRNVRRVCLGEEVGAFAAGNRLLSSRDVECRQTDASPRAATGVSHAVPE